MRGPAFVRLRLTARRLRRLADTARLRRASGSCVGLLIWSDSCQGSHRAPIGATAAVSETMRRRSAWSSRRPEFSCGSGQPGRGHLALSPSGDGRLWPRQWTLAFEMDDCGISEDDKSLGTHNYGAVDVGGHSVWRPENQGVGSLILPWALSLGPWHAVPRTTLETR